jgi:hypothetical protein
MKFDDVVKLMENDDAFMKGVEHVDKDIEYIQSMQKLVTTYKAATDALDNLEEVFADPKVQAAWDKLGKKLVGVYNPDELESNFIEAGYAEDGLRDWLRKLQLRFPNDSGDYDNPI